MSEVVNYDSLVASYYENLHTTLRRFSPGPEYLESWVHDENHLRSLWGIFEAAEDSGLDELTVQVSPDTQAALNREELLAELKQMGTVELKDLPAGWEIHVSFGKLEALPNVHPAYAKRLKEFARTLAHKGALSEIAGTKQYTATQDGVSLFCAIGPDGIVKAAKFEGAGAPSGMMEKFCDLLIGRPIQEGAEHGVIRLENEMRDRSLPSPVQGIVSPENADPIFKTPQALIRQIFKAYRGNTGSGIEWNSWEDHFSPLWASSSNEQRIEKVSQTLNALVREFSLPYPKIEILAIKNDCRVILVQPGLMGSKEFGHHLIMLERELQKRLEPRLELVLESLEDKNHRESRTKRENTFNDRSKNS